MTESNIRRTVLANGVRLATERMPHVRSVAVGIWLTRGSRHEPAEHAGIAHFVEHMLFKGTPARSAEEIAQQVDSIGGQIDAFTSKEYAGYYLKVLDEHLPLAVDILADLICNPLFADDDIEREKKVILEEIKMVEDTPDDLVHEIFAEGFWSNHPLGRPILGTPAQRQRARSDDAARTTSPQTYVARELRRRRGRQSRARARAGAARARARATRRTTGPTPISRAPVVAPAIQVRKKELEQSHIVFGTEALPQHHPERYAGYALNTTLGGSMSSRLFQNVREKRGLAYSVFSGLSRVSGRRRAQHLRRLRQRRRRRADRRRRRRDPADEGRRPRSGRAAPRQGSPEGLADARPREHVEPHVASGAAGDVSRSRPFGLDEMLAAIEKVTRSDVLRLADRFFTNGSLAVTVLGNVNGLQVTKEQLAL